MATESELPVDERIMHPWIISWRLFTWSAADGAGRVQTRPRERCYVNR